ncbi:cysteine desulfurase [bacterium]|nr:cysteine desulfurase [bacterium]
MLYLDHAATTPIRPETRVAMEPFLADGHGNPGGMHAVARAAKSALEDARERVAAAIGARHPLEVVFTGGGTESDNLAVAGAALGAGRRGGVVFSAIEHEAVRETAGFLGRLGCPVVEVPVDSDGLVDPDRVAASCDRDTAVVSVMAANNEVGVIQPVAEIAAAVREMSPSISVHSDAVQALVSEPVSIDDLGVDMLTISGHKLGGPPGVGALWVRDGLVLEPVLHGGGQEGGRRSGTPAVAPIVGLAAAVEAAVADRARFRRDVAAARDGFEQALAGLVPDAIVTASTVGRLVQHSHIRVPGVLAENLLINLDQQGLAAAAGSACHSGAVQASPVLRAMGWDDRAARECVRFTFGWTSDPGDGARAAARLVRALDGLR